jgi:hypothetical protein
LVEQKNEDRNPDSDEIGVYAKRPWLKMPFKNSISVYVLHYVQYSEYITKTSSLQLV